MNYRVEHKVFQATVPQMKLTEAELILVCMLMLKSISQTHFSWAEQFVLKTIVILERPLILNWQAGINSAMHFHCAVLFHLASGRLRSHRYITISSSTILWPVNHYHHYYHQTQVR